MVRRRYSEVCWSHFSLIFILTFKVAKSSLYLLKSTLKIIKGIVHVPKVPMSCQIEFLTWYLNEYPHKLNVELNVKQKDELNQHENVFSNTHSCLITLPIQKLREEIVLRQIKESMEQDQSLNFESR